MKIYKSVVLKKLGFSEKFPHRVLYARKIVLGISSIKLSIIIIIIIIIIIALKLYLGHKRIRSDQAEFIDIIKENT
jgi:hypothetical protein